MIGKTLKLTPNEVKGLFKKNLTNIFILANKCADEAEFKKRLIQELHLNDQENRNEAKQNIKRLIEYDGQTIYELPSERHIHIQTITTLWNFLSSKRLNQEISADYLVDIYQQFRRLKGIETKPITEVQLNKWMKKWPTGLDKDVLAIREANKERIISLLINKIDHRHSTRSRYIFEPEWTAEEKKEKVKEWWNDHRFQLSMAIRSPRELNEMLNHSLSKETMHLYERAKEKGMPIFITPYYLSLLNPTEHGFDDTAIRSYIIYSKELVDAFGNIHAWEKEDVIETGKPNAAGWLLPEGHNIHRRYPEVAIMIPDTMGRGCGGLCASCQRMYDFQSKRFNFNFKELKAKETWEHKLRRLMKYFENDTQLQDILITGGDALMSNNKELKNMLKAVLKMAHNKRKANLKRPKGEKYAEMHRVRLGSRLPVYLPMRIDDELIQLLKAFKQEAEKENIDQFFIQTHFQTPLEITPEALTGIKKIQSSGWIITNQLVFNVAASRRGHTAQLRKTLNELGIICYYTFTVKGFEENHAIYAPNSRSLQEEMEEKVFGKLDAMTEKDFLKRIRTTRHKETAIKETCKKANIPFIASDRNVMNLPGIGKSMSFVLVGILPDGRRVLEFDHDHTRHHSPIIEKMSKVYIRENKSIYKYLRQLHQLGERVNDYQTIWNYTSGQTEHRFPLYDYPKAGEERTQEYTNLFIE
ncbi:MAG: KamA family radical SAM protein [Phocaeicola sp.]|uniref:KamA family radical SAM protein n=1 Tax=Phocaeicola sp. TaxID=2773926 RepID=UPI003FA18F65